MKRRILITGASGFIGRNLFEAFSQREDWEVYGTYHTRKWTDSDRLLKADLRNKDEVFVMTRGMDTVVHAAAVTSGSRDILFRPHIHITDNTVMNSYLLEAAFQNRVSHFVLLSCTVMYPMDLDRPVMEEDVAIPKIHPAYFGGARVKLYAEDLCEFYSRLGKTRHTAVRHSNIYGPYDKYDGQGHVFASMIRNISEAKEGSEITIWGEGKEKRDLLHVYDLVRFIERAIDIEHSPCEVVNVGSGYAVSISVLTDMMIRISGKQLPIRYDRSKPVIDTRFAVNCTKAFTKFGWFPQVELSEGIRLTLGWYQENLGVGK